MSEILCTKVLPDEFNLNTIINNIPSNIDLTLYHNATGVWIQSNPLTENQFNLVQENLGDLLYIPPTEIICNYGKVTSPTGLNLRAEPNTDCSILQICYTGQRFKIVEDLGEWYKVELPQVGYLYKQYTEVSQTPSTVSDALVSFTESWEGFSSTAYQDAGGNWTIGYGDCTYNEEPNYTVTQAEAAEQLQGTLNNIASQIYSFVAKYNLCQSEFDSLVDFAYNLGVGALEGSDLLANLITCDNNVVITNDFTAWSYCDGNQLEGLVRRRIAEAKMFLFNEYINN